jgi:hypothetical protein
MLDMYPARIFDSREHLFRPAGSEAKLRHTLGADLVGQPGAITFRRSHLLIHYLVPR